jgi:dolichol-phosphate mannosyltransferase
MTTAKVSVIVPTYKESKNVESLTKRLFSTMKAHPELDCELVLVDDDSGQDTQETLAIVKKLNGDGYNVRVRVRTKSEGKGLSSAVLVGLRETSRDYCLVMDADLQHEPESVPSILKPIINGTADFSVGSRNVGGGLTSEDWPLVRRIISWGATALAKPLTTCSDPMSGFFALPRSTLERAKYLNPTGYKIGLELMVRCKCKKIVEIPIQFRDREAGESKLTMKQNLLYLAHLARLYWFMYPKLVVSFILLLTCLLLVFLYLIYFFLIAKE